LGGQGKKPKKIGYPAVGRSDAASATGIMAIDSARYKPQNVKMTIKPKQCQWTEADFWTVDTLLLVAHQAPKPEHLVVRGSASLGCPASPLGLGEGHVHALVKAASYRLRDDAPFEEAEVFASI
jgi:hypothetical protein